MAKKQSFSSFEPFNGISNKTEKTEQIKGQETIETLEGGKYMPDPPKVKIPPKEETRSKRVNLLLQPSVHEQAQSKCERMGISLNECINQLLKSWID